MSITEFMAMADIMRRPTEQSSSSNQQPQRLNLLGLPFPPPPNLSGMTAYDLEAEWAKLIDDGIETPPAFEPKEAWANLLDVDIDPVEPRQDVIDALHQSTPLATNPGSGGNLQQNRPAGYQFQAPSPILPDFDPNATPQEDFTMNYNVTPLVNNKNLFVPTTDL